MRKFFGMLLAAAMIFTMGFTAPTTSAAAYTGSHKVSISTECVRNNSVGNEWSKSFQLNDKAVSSGDSVSLKVGDKITVSAKIIERDDGKDDIGTASKTHTVTKADLENGFTMELDVTVTENGGRYKGNSASWTVTYSFS